MAWVYEIGVAKYFNEEQKQNNAQMFYSFFNAKGVSLESICGMLGNIERESTLNPGIEQDGGSGLGLIQWTPGSILIDWCQNYGYVWYDGNAQCDLIWCEGTGENGAGGYWLPTNDYPYSWEEFIALKDVNEATKAYLYERERAGVEALDERLENAAKWYEYLCGHPPDPPDPPDPPGGKQSRMPIYFYLKRR